MDRLTPERRSWNMGRIKGRDTAPERAVRSIVHQLGYRFRLHRVDLPGRPDLALPRLRTVLFVHGCFWHRHRGCKYAYSPKSNLAFWEAKFAKNRLRDKQVRRLLKKDGWRVLVVWECETSNLGKLSGRLQTDLGELG